MAHGIQETDTLLYNGSTAGQGGTTWDQSTREGGTPWHGLGIALPGVMTRSEVREHAPNFTAPIHKTPVMYNGEPVKGQYLTIRTLNDGTEHVLGVVGSEYRVSQNDSMLEWAEQFCQDPSGPLFETVGTLWNGRKSFVLAKFPTDMIVKGRSGTADVIGQYLLFSTSHDGSSHLQVQFTPIRVVCQNTLNMAGRGKDKNTSAYIMHSGDVNKKMANVANILGIAQRKFTETQELYQALVNVEPTREQVDAVLQQLIPDTTSNRAKLQRERVLTLSESGRGNAPYAGTGWGIYNGFTELVDHHNNTGSKREDINDFRLDNIWFGSGMANKQKALEVCTAGFLN